MQIGTDGLEVKVIEHEEEEEEEEDDDEEEYYTPIN